MSDLDSTGGVLPLPETESLGQCGYCKRTNRGWMSMGSRAFDCCDPTPATIIPASELSTRQQAYRRKWLSELRADEGGWDLRAGPSANAPGDATTQRPQPRRPWANNPSLSS